MSNNSSYKQKIISLRLIETFELSKFELLRKCIPSIIYWYAGAKACPYVIKNSSYQDSTVFIKTIFLEIITISELFLTLSYILITFGLSLVK